MLGKCDHDGCQGHLGKFSSCVDEAVWELSMDPCSSDRSTGRTEAYGHFTAMTFHADEEHTLSDGTKVTIPEGWYMVEENDQGFVWAIKYDSESELDQAFEQHDQRYSEWLEINEPD